MYDEEGGVYESTPSSFSSSLVPKLGIISGDVYTLNTMLSSVLSGVVGGMSGRPCGSLGVFSLCVLWWFGD